MSKEQLKQDILEILKEYEGELNLLETEKALIEVLHTYVEAMENNIDGV